MLVDMDLVKIGVYPCKDVPIVQHLLLSIPAVLLYITFHVQQPPEPRLDPIPLSTTCISVPRGVNSLMKLATWPGK
jgi:hypothetical protein